MLDPSCSNAQTSTQESSELMCKVTNYEMVIGKDREYSGHGLDGFIFCTKRF